MPWLAIWFVLVVLALTFFAYLGRRLYLQGKAVVREAGAMSAALSRVGTGATSGES